MRPMVTRWIFNINNSSRRGRAMRRWRLARVYVNFFFNNLAIFKDRISNCVLIDMVLETWVVC